MSKTKLIALITIFLDILGFTIMIPAMPALANDYNVAYSMITLGSTLYALCGLFSTPMLGGRSDKWGRRPIILISMIGSMLAYFSIAVSHNIRMFLIGMVINGITAGNIGAAQSILSDVAKDPQERVKNLGLFGMIFGVSFIIGPVIGALALKLGNHGPFWTSGILAAINITSAIFFLRETHTKREEHTHIKLNILHIFQDIITGKERIYYLVYFLINLGIMIYQSTYLLFLNKHFNIPGSIGGLILGSYGLIMIINQVVLMKKVWLKLTPNVALSISFLGFIFCYTAAFIFPFQRSVILFIAATTLFQGLFRPIMQNLILGENKNIGLINGNMLNLMNIANIFGPLIGGALLDKNLSPFGLSALVILIAYVIFKKYISNHLHKKEKQHT